MTAKSATTTRERLVTRAAIVRTPAGITYDGLPNARNGFLPWKPQYEKNVRLGDLARVRVNADDLMPCPRHEGLEFLDEAALARHVADDERLIETLRERIPALGAQADALDAAAEGTSAADFPLMLDAGFLATRQRDGYKRDAERKRGDAQKLREELEKMGVTE